MAQSSDAKSELNPELVFSKMAWGIGWTIIRALKSLKKCTLIGFFCQKHIMFQLENFRENMLWHWRVMQNLKENDSGLKNKYLVDFHVRCRKPGSLHFGGLLLSKAYEDLDEKV